MTREKTLRPLEAAEARARPERFELPTAGSEVRSSIQLSYERIDSARAPSGGRM